MKNVLSVFSGLITAWIVIMLTEYFSHLLFPLPGNVDSMNAEVMREMIVQLPAVAFLLVLLAGILGSFTGGLVAALVADQHKTGMSLIVGLILMTGGILNAVTIPQPLWFSVINLLLYLPSAYLGGRTGLKLKS